MKMTSLIDRYTAHVKKGDLAPTTKKVYSCHLKSLRGLFGDQLVVEFNGIEGAKKLREILATYHGTNTTKNKLIDMLNYIYEYGLKEGI